MKIVCECLNLKIEVENFHSLEVVNLELLPEEKSHPYFSEVVYKMPGNVGAISEVHSQLVKSKIVGSWNIRQCLICKVFTHGTNYVTGLATCSSVLKEEPVDLKAYGQLKNISYSQVFHVCFPSRLDISEDYLSLTNCDLVASDYIENISRQANSFLEMAKTKMKNSNAPLEKQEQAMEALNRRVKCEESFLHMLVLQSKNKNDLTSEGLSKSGSYQYEADIYSSGFDKSATRYTKRLSTSESLSGNNNVHHCDTELQRARLNISNDSDDLQKDFGNLKLTSSLERKHLQDKRSSLSEGIFEMDDFASNVSAAAYIPEHDESDSEEEVFPEFSNEELEENIARDFARSVPVDVPAWPCAIDRHERAFDTKGPRDPQEIAASMRELARSVRTSSVDVFGELPRSKFLP